MRNSNPEKLYASKMHKIPVPRSPLGNEPGWQTDFCGPTEKQYLFHCKESLTTWWSTFSPDRKSLEKQQISMLRLLQSTFKEREVCWKQARNLRPDSLKKHSMTHFNTEFQKSFHSWISQPSHSIIIRVGWKRFSCIADKNIWIPL